jgi:glycosyltransferase involved in cell wall biosynthesis
VTYGHGGQADFLKDNETGFLVALGDRERFRRCIELLCADADLRAAMGRNNHALSKRFTIGNCVTQYEKAFLQTVACASSLAQAPHAPQRTRKMTPTRRRARPQ